MRIFFAVHDSANHLPQNRSWYNNLYLALVSMGHQVVRFRFDLHGMAIHQDESIPANAEWNSTERPKLEESLMRQIAEADKVQPIDLFFSYFASSYCSNAMISSISAMGIPTVNWFCNASYQFHLVERIAPSFDYCLVPEKYRLEDYRRAGANPIYCQEAANPLACSSKNTGHAHDVSFVGGRYADRFAHLSFLYRNGVTPTVWGENWQRKPTYKSIIRKLAGKSVLPSETLKGYLADEDLPSTFRNSRVNLGFNVCGSSHTSDTPIRQVRLRDFEVPMSGGFYLAQHSGELTEFFEPEREIVTFCSKEELLDKCRYYLKHPQESETIRQAGHRRALAEHTWQCRLSNAFQQMNFQHTKTARKAA